MKKVILTMTLAAILTASSASAKDLAIGFTGGTIGLGLEGTMNIVEKVNLRVLAAGFNYSKNGSYGTDATFDGKLNMFNAGIVVDYYPFTSGLRLSAGGIYNGTKVTVDGVPTAGSTYTINNVTYTSAQVGNLHGEVKYQKVMPYIGLGFGNTMTNSNFTFGMDFGAMIGTPTASLTATNPTNNATLASNVAAEEKNLKDNVNKLSVYPVINLSLSYRF